MLDVERWAELGASTSSAACRSRSSPGGRGCRATRCGVALRSSEQPIYRRVGTGSKLDPFTDEIHRLLREEPRLTGVRVRELIEPLGFAGSKTIVDDYLREVRPLFAPPPRSLPADRLSAR